ncbi:MAG: hypothetical protein JWM57_2671 [Phycisphaerales bacterium]|nr:hypothetical protein [Phycisphaerales bacterium]
MRSTLTLAALLALSSPIAVFADSPMPAAAPTPPASQPAAPKDMLNTMLKPGTERRKALQPIQGAPLQDKTVINPVAPGARPMMLRREGSYVVDRTGRVKKTADGRDFEFNFEADASTMQDPPMIIIPNLSLMMMQDQIRLSGRDARFRVTGMITEYMGRNYLLLQKVVTINDQ